MPSRFASLLLASALALAGCQTRDLPPGPPPQFEAEVQPILREHCVRCHGGADPDAAWSAQSYLSSIACIDGGEPATVGDDDAPILRALERPDHAKLLGDAERATLRAWVLGGAPSGAGALHPAGWLDPRSPEFHGTVLRDEGFARMLGLREDGACGQCHAGGPVRAAELSYGPTRAPACTSCHRASRGVLACGTCHGDGADRAYPPRDPCFFPDGPAAGAHAAHVTASKLRAGVLACTTCHPSVDADAPFTDSHADGHVDIVFDTALAGDDASYDEKTHTCMVACHVRKEPSWTKPSKLDCNGCHSSPPADHYPGECSTCHPGVNADGSAFRDASLHINGRVDLGRDGSQRCGSCHGDGADDPWPATRAHPAHRTPAIAPEVACASCHKLPTSVRAEGHIDRSPGAELTFGAAARARDSEPSYDATRKTCAEVACHGAKLLGSTAAMPRWESAQPGDAVCGSCHTLPPAAPHIQDAGCEAVICHGAEVSRWPDGPKLTEAGRLLHINGAIDFAPR